MTTVSVIIVSYNARGFLLDCLRSLYNEATRAQLEVIVVDNASTDGSVDAVRADYPQVVLVENDGNVGFARANNQAIAIAQGQVLALVNSDVELRPGAIDALLDVLDREPAAGLLGPRVLNRDGSLQPSCTREPTYLSVFAENMFLHRLLPGVGAVAPLKMNDWAHDEERPVDGVTGCFWFARRAAVDEVGPLDERFFFYAEDTDWCKRFRAAGWQVRFCPGAEIYHYGGGSSQAAPTRYYIERRRANLKYWRKHHGQAGVLWYAFCTFLGQSLRAVGWAALWVSQPRRRAENRALLARSLATLRFVLSPGPLHAR